MTLMTSGDAKHARPLIKILRDAGQDVPDALLELAAKGGGGGGGKGGSGGHRGKGGGGGGLGGSGSGSENCARIGPAPGPGFALG